jgi:hypothetical protein
MARMRKEIIVPEGRRVWFAMRKKEPMMILNWARKCAPMTDQWKTSVGILTIVILCCPFIAFSRKKCVIIKISLLRNRPSLFRLNWTKIQPSK